MRKFICLCLGAVLLLTACGERAKNTEANILESRQALGADGVLSHIPNVRVEVGVQQKLLPYQDKLLLYGSAAGEDGPVLELALLSMKTGEVLCETVFTDVETPNVQVCGDTIAVADWGDGEVRFLDSALRAYKEHTTGVAGAVYLSPDGDTLFAFTQNNGVQLSDLETGESRALLTNARELLPSGINENVVTAVYTHWETGQDSFGAVRLDTETAEEIVFPGNAYGVTGNGEMYIAGVRDEEDAYYLMKEDGAFLLRTSAENGVLNLLPGRILEIVPERDGPVELRLYRPDGTFISGCRLPEGTVPVHAPIEAEGYAGLFFTVTDDDGRDKLLYWDTDMPVTGENLHVQPIE